MASLDEKFITATVSLTARPVNLRVGDLAAHFAERGWHCSAAAENVVTFTRKKKFRWFFFIILWLFAGLASVIGLSFFVAVPLFYVLFYFISREKNRTIVLQA